jgi:hypothetical protein
MLETSYGKPPIVCGKPELSLLDLVLEEYECLLSFLLLLLLFPIMRLTKLDDIVFLKDALLDL